MPYASDSEPHRHNVARSPPTYELYRSYATNKHERAKAARGTWPLPIGRGFFYIFQMILRL